MRWIDVKSALPRVPKGKHGVPVIVSAHDPIYEQINPGKGSSTETCIYEEERGFLILGCGGNTGWKFHQMVDVVTHWMYYPEPKQVKKL